MTIQKFTDLEAWKNAHELTLLIYKTTSKFPKSEEFGLKSQLRRAAISVESCIAEGFSRYHFKDRLNFYFMARGSVAEIQSQILTSRDLRLITPSKFNTIFEQTKLTAIILSGLIKSTEKLSRRKS
jgi:four helix bundle protein